MYLFGRQMSLRFDPKKRAWESFPNINESEYGLGGCFVVQIQ